MGNDLTIRTTSVSQESSRRVAVAIFKRFYTHHYSIRCLVQLSPPPMPPCSRPNVMSAPFDRIQKHTIRAGYATMGKGVVAVLRQRPREKFRFVPGSGFLHFVMRASCTVGVSRSTNRLSIYAWAISNGMETVPPEETRGWRSRKYYHFLFLCRTLDIVSPLRRISRGGRDWKREGADLEWRNEGKVLILDFSNDIVKIILPNSWRIQTVETLTACETLISKLISSSFATSRLRYIRGKRDRYSQPSQKLSTGKRSGREERGGRNMYSMSFAISSRAQTLITSYPWISKLLITPIRRFRKRVILKVFGMG